MVSDEKSISILVLVPLWRWQFTPLAFVNIFDSLHLEYNMPKDKISCIYLP
jgi:hypothetical protein